MKGITEYSGLVCFMVLAGSLFAEEGKTEVPAAMPSPNGCGTARPAVPACCQRLIAAILHGF